MFDVSSCRTEALVSHHFLLEASLDASIEEKLKCEGHKKKLDRKGLDDNSLPERFVAAFEQTLSNDNTYGAGVGHCNHLGECITKAFVKAERVLPTLPTQSRKPWISHPGLDFNPL